MCLVCVELYSNSRPGEKWVQYIQCKGWVHEEYADIGFVLTFTCQNCNSKFASEIQFNVLLF